MDAEERDALARLDSELAVLRARHAHDPAVELLLAARAGVLPEGVQERMERYLATSRWSRTLVAGFDDVQAGVEVEEDQASRLLARITREARSGGRFAGFWMWPAVATAAGAALAVVLIAPRERSAPPVDSRPPAVVPAPAPAPAPAFRLPLEKPPLKVGASALTWRGSDDRADLLVDLKPAFDAFRADRYDVAQEIFATLERRYPSSSEVFFYRGVARLFLNDYQGAVESLTRAARLGDPAFVVDAAWYRAVAEERAGSLAAARRDLEAVCRTSTARGAGACAALTDLTSSFAQRP
jgi:hypothetical protein